MGVENVAVKLRAKVQEGKFYEAEQMYRTLHHRCLLFSVFARSW